jgi:hypothetical protein
MPWSLWLQWVAGNSTGSNGSRQKGANKEPMGIYIYILYIYIFIYDIYIYMYIRRYKILALCGWCRLPSGNPFSEFLFGLQRLSVWPYKYDADRGTWAKLSFTFWYMWMMMLIEGLLHCAHVCGRIQPSVMGRVVISAFAGKNIWRYITISIEPNCTPTVRTFSS